MTHEDDADTTRLSESIETILPALSAFNRFEGRDPAARDRHRWQAALGRPLPETGAGIDTVVKELCDIAIPNGLRNGHPGFSAWITTAPTTAGAVACLAATVAGSQRWCVQPFNFLETLALQWLRKLFGLKDDMQGTFSSGGSIANLIALGAARQSAFERIGIDPAEDGLPAGRRWAVYASTELHHVSNRAAAVLGLGRRSVVTVPTDEIGRIRVTVLREILERDRAAGIVPVSIIATAGTVNTGAIDPIEEMADLADEFGTWLHVDGAYGMFGILDDRVRELYAGVDRADSVAADPHKWLAAPVGCGATFVRDRALLKRAYTLEPAEYLEGSVGVEEIESPFDDFGDTYHDLNLEQSSAARGAHVWAILREIGAQGIRARVVRHNTFARRVVELARASDSLELVCPPTLSICCLRYVREGLDDEKLDGVNNEIVRRLRAEGSYVPSTTVVNGKVAIRPCYINPRARMADVEGLVGRVIELGDDVG